MAFTTDLGVLTALDDEQLYQLCRTHPDIKFERTPGGYLVILSPTGGETGNRNSEIGAEFVMLTLGQQPLSRCKSSTFVKNGRCRVASKRPFRCDRQHRQRKIDGYVRR